MKTILLFQSEKTSNKEIETFIVCVNKFKDIKCSLSAFDVDARRKLRPVLATFLNNKIEMTDIFNYDEISAAAKEGYNLVTVDSLSEYADKLANTYKYC